MVISMSFKSELGKLRRELSDWMFSKMYAFAAGKVLPLPPLASVNFMLCRVVKKVSHQSRFLNTDTSQGNVASV